MDLKARGLLLMVALLLAGAGLISFSSREEPDEPTPTRSARAESSDPLPALKNALRPLDSARGERPGIVTIALLRGGKPEIGPRLVLRNAQGVEVSRTTDVMGLAKFELPPGSWLVMAPEELLGQGVEVTTEPSEVTLTLPGPRRVEGTVLDERGAPAPDVPITVVQGVDSDDDDPSAKVVARSDVNGRFSFDTAEADLVLCATRGEARARRAIAPPVHGLELRLEESAWLTLSAPPHLQVIASLSFRDGRQVRQFNSSVKVRVPAGEVDARALTVLRKKLLRATHRLVVKGGAENELELVFTEAPPVSGVVMDAHHTPLAGVTVGLSLAGNVPRALEQVVTDARGHFELVPRLIKGGDPLYEVHVLAPWKETRAMLVRLGDAPLTVEAQESE